MASQKIYNHEYAPGIATYGMIGETGLAGENGNSMFYTSYDIYRNNRSDIEKFLQKLKSNMLPVHNSTVVLNRKYQNGDYFFDNEGHVFRLVNVDDIYNNSIISYIWSNYLTLCGNINTSSSDSYVSRNEAGRLNLNNEYQGLDIITNNTGYSPDASTKFALRLMSDNPNNENNINFIKLSAIYTEYLDNEMSFYYDSGLNAYHIKTNGPLLLDGQVRIKDDQSNDSQLDGYSKVVIHETPVTTFYNFCQHVSFLFTTMSDVDSGKIVKMEMQIPIVITDDNANIFWNKVKDKITLKIQLKATYEPLDQSDKTEADYEHALQSEVIHTYMQKLNIEFDVNDVWSQEIDLSPSAMVHPNFVTHFRDYDISIVAVSLIYNTEIFVDFKIQ